MRHMFRIVTVADPQALPRVCGVLAQRALTPERFSARYRDGKLCIALALDLDPATARIIAAKLGEAVLVEEVACREVKGDRS